ncbi:MAG: hypothetical protein ACRC62_26880, partial [Microcoleus sp.]
VNNLSSTFLDRYLIVPINNNRDLAIQNKASPFAVPGTPPLDTIAVIEGGGNLSLNVLPALPSSSVFTVLIG